MPNIEWNRDTWDQEHVWSGQGDEWTGMAEHCGQPYSLWKDALVEEFLLPYLSADARVLEVAPGHGRFSGFIVNRAASTTLVDLSPTCLAQCRSRFGDSAATYVLTDGTSLPGVADRSIDFIWSFDSFVHMEKDVIDDYLAEFYRALVPGGTFIIHHAGKRDWSLRFVPATKRLGIAGRVGQRLLSQGRLHDTGRRADVSKEMVTRLAHAHGLTILDQQQSWGAAQQFTVAKYGDWITTGLKTA